MLLNSLIYQTTPSPALDVLGGSGLVHVCAPVCAQRAICVYQLLGPIDHTYRLPYMLYLRGHLNNISATWSLF